MDNSQFQNMVLDDLKEIRKEQAKTCIEIAEQKKDFTNHIDAIEDRKNTKKINFLYLTTGISIMIAIISLSGKVMNLFS